MSAGNDNSAHVMRQIEQLKWHEAEQTGYEGDLDSALMLLDQASCALINASIRQEWVWSGVAAPTYSVHMDLVQKVSKLFRWPLPSTPEYSPRLKLPKPAQVKNTHWDIWNDLMMPLQVVAEWLRPQFVDFHKGLAFVESNLAQKY